MKSVQIRQRPLLTVVLGTSEASASAVFAIVDVLSSVGRDWEMLHGRAPGPAAFRPMLLSLDGQAYREPNGNMVQPQGKLADHPAPDLVIVPDLHLDPAVPLPNSFAVLADWIRSAHERGAMVASICSGTMLLAEAGLLDGEDATTHWAFCDALSRRFPRVRVRGARILVPAGVGHRVITAGGASSWQDLLLYLIGRLVSPEEARRIAKVYLLQAHTEGQLPFASLAAGRQHEDKLVAEAQLWAADNYGDSNPVAVMVARSGLSERSFLRRFRRATGQSPLDYIQTLRIEEAKQLLETTDKPLEEVAVEVGYVEPSSFRRLFRKLVGITASDYRRRRLPAPASFG
jgi:transcriptional regulator GlxA family with amidase domain